ncbi:hypothetical protein COCMIDRAFT_40810 [Bipolaris oryzae ATCC 44560]|uniref:Uncharacterized protein n=1 Tax=Bipolaris oryzae ATCC 44560 TaxID=930090 RepID=W6YZI5_COCMI|nr:uncharacterized protein COCMIDRAFT_40810 [Bipolaris oryzae ATCC 44560]EUC40949.1 hypothetical protein COCMIDRAFT_40810 [Bipolaris oryzae ATCC 44560]
MHFLHALVVIVATLGNNVDAIAERGLEAKPQRILRAATKRSDLYRRGVRITKRFETEMAYVENQNAWSDASTFASQVRVSSQKPVFTLEEYEHHLKAVECGNNAMKLHFVDASSARDARAAYGEDGGLIITSHASCNGEGEREVYRITDVSFAEDGEALDLSVKKTTWRQAFDRMDVTFGHTTDDHIVRRHADFAMIRSKRQNRVAIPQNVSEDVNTALFDLNSEIVDKTFAVKDFLEILGAAVPLPSDLPVAVPIEIGCKRCATTGQLALNQGAFNIDLSQIDLIPDIFQGGDDGKEISSVISGGFVELVATGVGARLDLFARPSANGAFEIALIQLPIAGFVIPGIGNAGAIFEPRIAAEFEVSGGLEVNYGLELNVPDNSRLRVELTNLGASSLVGFQDTTLTPLPVTVNITDVDVTLGLTFKPAIPIGFDFLGQLSAEVTATLDLPRLDAKLSTNIAENCASGDNATVPSAPYANNTKQLSPDLIQLGPIALVEANVSISCDLSFDVSIPILPPPFNKVSVARNVFKAEFPLVSECKSPETAFDDASGIVVPAPPVVAPPAESESVALEPPANATYVPVHTVPVVNYTISSTVALSAATTLSSVVYTAPAYIPAPGNSASTNCSTTPSYTATPDVSATASMTNASISTAPYLNISASYTSATYPAPSEPASTTIMASNSSSSTALASSYVNSNSTAMINYPIPVMSTSCESSSTSIITTTSYITYNISRTSTTSAAEAPTLDAGFSFSLFSTVNPEAVAPTSMAETSSTPESTSTPESIPASSSPAPVTTSSEESASSTSSPAPAVTSSPQESSVPTPSSIPAVSSAISSAVSTVVSSAVSPSSTPAESSTTPSESTPATSSAASSPSSPAATSTPIASSQPSASQTPSRSSLAPLPPPIPFMSGPLPSLAATLSEAPGFLVPTNASALPVVQTSIVPFTGAASRAVQIPYLAKLGIDYLWIDSLCIVQNNEQDWNQQALRMADVYQNAYITIAAVAARNSEEGLFNDISDRRISYPLPDHPWVHVRRRIRVPSRKPQFMDMLSDDGFPLYKRGWVFQELSLSPRVIHYGREELIWHCRANSRYEGVPKGFYNLPTLVRADLRGFSTQLMWHKIVASFSWRKLTFEKDRLPAIAAFATLIQPQDCEKRYIHGLWEETLRSDLLWSVDTYGAGQNTLGCRSNRLPSWSWTSTARPVQWCNTPYLDNCQEIPYTKIKEILYSTRGPVILGDARQATIVIQAPILRLCDIKFVRYSCDLIENLHHGLGWSAPQWDTPIDAEIYGKQDTKALAIPLLSMKRNVVRRDVCQYRNALLIAETSEIGKYKRLGVVTIDVDNDVDFETAVLDSRKGLSVDEKATRATARTERYDRFMQVLGEMETHTITLL